MSKYNDVMNKIEVTEDMRNRILQNIAKEFDENPPKDEEHGNADTDNVTEFKVNENVTSQDNVRSFQPKGGLYKFTKYAGLAAAAVILLVGATVIFGPKEKGAMESATMAEMALEVAHEAAADVHHEAEFIKGSWVKYDSVEQLADVAGVDFTEIEYLNSISSEVDYYLDGGDTATIVYDVTGNQVTISEAVAATAEGNDDIATDTDAYMAAEATAGTDKVESPKDIIGGSGIVNAGKNSTSSKNQVVSEEIAVSDIKVRVYGTEEGYNRAAWTVDDLEYNLECVEKISLEEMTELMNNILAF